MPAAPGSVAEGGGCAGLYGATLPSGATLESQVEPVVPSFSETEPDPPTGCVVGDASIKGIKRPGWDPENDSEPEVIDFDIKMTDIVKKADVVKEEAMDQMVSWTTGVITVNPLVPDSQPTREEAIDLFAQKRAASRIVTIEDYEIVDSSDDEDVTNVMLDDEIEKVLAEVKAVKVEPESPKKARVAAQPNPTKDFRLAAAHFAKEQLSPKGFA
jgi:hypothetical protein